MPTTSQTSEVVLQKSVADPETHEDLKPLTNQEKAFHVLSRFSYGPKPGQVESLSHDGDHGLKVWFESQLSAPLKDSDEINKKLLALKSLKLTNQEMLKAYPQDAMIKKMNMDKEMIEGKPNEILRELTLQKIVRAVESENQLAEVLTDFWFNHFNVNFEKGVVKQAITSYERDVIRPNIFGKFEDLLMATAKSPAMLIYLDNKDSKKDNINENYARELMELHTLGVDGGYTQTDIQEAARVLTGWGVEKPREISRFKFFKGQHDKGSKKVLGNVFNGNGLAEGERLIRILAHHPSTAQFIAKKLAIKFVSDKPEHETINEIANVFTKSGGDLKETYRAIFNSKEFFSPAAFKSKIKTPLEYVASVARTGSAAVVAETEKINKLKSFFDQSGEALYRCQPPTGYKAVSEYWVNSGAMVNRINFALAFANNRIPQFDFSIDKIDDEIKDKKFSEQLKILEFYNGKYFNSSIRAETLKKINNLITDSNSFFTEDRKQLPLHYFKTKKLFALMLSSPEYQRR